MSIHRRITDLYVSLSYRWADAKQIRDDILREPERRPCNGSEYPEMLGKLGAVEKDLLDTLELVRESRRLLNGRYDREIHKSIDILANQGNTHASL